jgi:hypothetical protein
MTPNEFAIVPRQRSTTQLPPHLRLDEDHSDSPEDLLPVETLVNAAILAFHEQHHRLATQDHHCGYQVLALSHQHQYLQS